MRSYFFVVGFVMIVVQLSTACTFFPDTFCATANIQTDDFIASGYITNVDSDGIDFEILSIIRGAESRTNIRIWDGTDFDCNGLLSMAAADFGVVGDTLVIIMPKITTIENTWEVVGDYRRPNNYTLTTVLQVTDGIAYGLIQGDATAPSESNVLSFPLDELVELYSEDQNCTQITDVQDLDFDLEFNIYPNPAADQVTISCNGINANTQLKIYDAMGRTIVQERVSTSSSTMLLDYLSTGVYTVVVYVDGIPMATERLVRL